MGGPRRYRISPQPFTISPSCGIVNGLGYILYRLAAHALTYTYTAANLLYARKHAPQADLEETERIPPESQERVEVGSADEEASPPPGSARVDYNIYVCKHFSNGKYYYTLVSGPRRCSTSP